MDETNKKKMVTDTSDEHEMQMVSYEALAIGLTGGRASDAILNQEKRGQAEAVNSDQLPTKGLLGADRHVFEAMGIKILDNQPTKDALFTLVELPEGWKKVSTDHSLWNNLVDAKGRVRATFFYKAAFYDRDAFIRPCRRFSIERNFSRDGYRETFYYEVRDGQKVIFSMEEPVPFITETGRRPEQDYNRSEEVEKEVRQKCAAWLVDNGFPSYNEPNAHWD